MSCPYQIRAYMLSKSKCLAQSYPIERLETNISNFQLLSEITLTGTGAFKVLAQEIRLRDEILLSQKPLSTKFPDPKASK